MNIEDIKNSILNIVNEIIYKSNIFTEDIDSELSKITDYLKDNKNILEDTKSILKDRNNENYIYFDDVIIKIYTRLTKDIKLNILYNSDVYYDIFKSKIVLLRIWQTLPKKDKVKFITDKNKCNDIDYYLFNEAVKEKTNYRENYILQEIIDNEDVRNKIPYYSLEVNVSPSMINHIDLTNFELCSKFSKRSYTSLVVKACSVLDDFQDLINNDERLINLLEKNSIIFKNTEKKYVVEYLKNNPNMIGKFDKKYLTYFSLEDIEKVYKSNGISNETFSAVLERLYKLCPERVNELFLEENLSKCVKHSINVYPFEKMDNKLKIHIFDNHNLFNRFLDTIMIEAIINNNTEEEIMNMLRNPVFINDQSPYSIELLLNKLSFKTVFNMLQIKSILDSITLLNVTITENDKVFVKGYVDSPSLVCKTDHSMLYRMLRLLSKEDVYYYIVTPYIASHMTNDELIELGVEKGITIEEILSSNVLKELLNKDDVITYIDRCWQTKVNLSIFNNKELTKIVFDLDDEKLNEIDFDEVNYLFETIKMKSMLSKQDNVYSVLTYKSVIAAYLSLGIDSTIKIVTDGNKGISLDDVRAIRNSIIQEKTLRFKEENSTTIQNIYNKINENLGKIKKTDDINEFAKLIKRNTYLDNIVYLMLENNYYTYNYIIGTFYDYVRDVDGDPYFSKKNLYNFCNGFINRFVDNAKEKYDEEFFEKMYSNFKLKDSIIYSNRKMIAASFMKKQRMKIFVDVLQGNGKDYRDVFNEGFELDKIKENYIDLINIEENEFDNLLDNILIPFSLGTFDKELCLKRMGINKPEDYDLYYNYMKDMKDFNKINRELKKLKSSYSKEDIIKIMIAMLYTEETDVKLKEKDKKTVRKLNNIFKTIESEIYLDKNELQFTFADRSDSYDLDAVIEYGNYIKIIDQIVTRTNNFLSKNMNDKRIEQIYKDEYIKKLSLEKIVKPLNSQYYELKKRVLSLKDLEKIFNGYRLNEYNVLSNPDKEFLIKSKDIIMVAEGYYDGIVDNLGLIINNIDTIRKEYSNYFPDEEINLINMSKVLKLISYDIDVISKSIDRDIIKSVTDDDYYIDTDVRNRIKNLEFLYKESFKKVSSTVPYVDLTMDDYHIFVVDNYNQDMFRYAPYTNYRIGARGNDFLHYVVLNKNGIKIIIEKDNKIIATVLGVRNGNTLYLNKVEGLKDDNYEVLLHSLVREIIKITKDSNEPIEFVMILVNKLLTRSSGIKVDSTLCPIIDNPFNTSYNDFMEFKKDKYLNTISNDIFYSNYREKVDTVLASSQVIDKNNFRYYDPEDKYLRKRNNVLKLSNNIEDYYIYKINTIINLCKLENVLEFDGDIKLSTIDTIYLGDDFVIFITRNYQLIKYVLPYDERALNEVNLIINSLK